MQQRDARSRGFLAHRARTNPTAGEDSKLPYRWISARNWARGPAEGGRRRHEFPSLSLSLSLRLSVRSAVEMDGIRVRVQMRASRCVSMRARANVSVERLAKNMYVRVLYKPGEYRRTCTDSTSRLHSCNSDDLPPIWP